MLLLAVYEPVCIQNVKFTARNVMVLKGNYFEQMNKIVLVFDHFDWDVACCEAVDIYVFKLFNNFTDFDLYEQIWLYL